MAQPRGCLFALLSFLAPPQKRQEYPYITQPGLLTAAEAPFYSVLQRAVPPGHSLLCKIRLADVIKVSNAGDRSASTRAFNRIAGKHLDFLLCTGPTLKSALAIELDDSTHTRPDRQQRDNFLDAALAAAAIPILHVKAARGYDAEQLRREIEGKLGVGVVGPTLPR